MTLPLPLNELQIVLSQAMEPDFKRLRGTSSYGLGLQIFHLRNGRSVIGHGGSTIGARAMLYVAPDTGEALIGLAAGENGHAILAEALCDWRGRMGGEQTQCGKLAQPLLFDAYRAGGAKALASRYRELRRAPDVNMHDFVLLDVLSRLTDESELTAAQRETLLRQNWRRFPHSAATAAALARSSVARGDRRAARIWARRALALLPDEADFAELKPLAR